MKLDPDEEPKVFLTFLLAAGLKMFNQLPMSDSECFVRAEKFIEEAERRYGPIK